LVHDISFFENSGRPSVAVFTEAFKPQARYQAKALNAPLCPRIFVPHPISDNTPEQVYLKAEEAFQGILDRLLHDDFEEDLRNDEADSKNDVAVQPGAAEPSCAS